jgi:hypothetical protein
VTNRAVSKPAMATNFPNMFVAATDDTQKLGFAVYIF